MSRRRDGGWWRRAAGAWGIVTLALLAGGIASARGLSDERFPFAARAGIDLAAAAARVWSSDAALIYLENDEHVADDGSAQRWGYLFYSPVLKKCRAYSVRGGRILEAEDLDIKIEAPPVNASWIDSGPALAAAEQAAGNAFRQQHHGALATMLLSRGAFDSDDPDETTWTVVYASPDSPSLFVLVDAASGRVRRTWRG